MRVLQLVNTFGPIGGLEVYVARLSERLCGQSHTTLIVANDLADPGATPYEVRHIPGFASRTGLGELEAEEKVLNIAANFQPDIVVSHNTANPRLLTALDSLYPTVEFIHVFLCAGGKLFRRGDRVCTHTVGPRCLVDWYVKRCGSVKSPQVAWETYRRATMHIEALKTLTGIVVGSDFMRQYLIGEGVPEDKIFISDNTIGIPQEQPVRRSSESDKNILFVGRVAYNKGVQYAIRALTILDESFRLTVVGDGYYLDALKQMAVSLGVEKRVDFAGFLHGADLEEAYRRATVAVVPSIWPEPVGLVVPEPRGRGLPVVAFDVGALGEWSRHYEAIYLAKHADPRSLARKIESACAGEPTGSQGNVASTSKPLEQLLQEITATHHDNHLAVPPKPCLSMMR